MQLHHPSDLLCYTLSLHVSYCTGHPHFNNWTSHSTMCWEVHRIALRLYFRYLAISVHALFLSGRNERPSPLRWVYRKLPIHLIFHCWNREGHFVLVSVYYITRTVRFLFTAPRTVPVIFLINTSFVSFHNTSLCLNIWDNELLVAFHSV